MGLNDDRTTERLHQEPGEWHEQHWNLLQLFYLAMRTAGLPVVKITTRMDKTMAGVALDGPRRRQFGDVK